jgi:RNA polymerase sigma-70 factor (ECF subfamily)
MSIADIITGLHKHDRSVKKHLFDTYYGKLFAIVIRYAKNQIQANEVFNVGFNNCLQKLQHQKHNQQLVLDTFLEKEIIKECIAFIKNIRSEYYVASTVYATNKDNKNYDLFEANELIDYSTIDSQILISALQKLVPSQRLIFNLHIIDGYSQDESALLLEASEQTVKSNLEKARFNLQKNIEKCLKETKYEQSL